ncbi:hypothetical protein O6H91_02G024300 [Diphasiastrum complanatum]|uniref:Uncharacterized protein n=1 Tax=Diphasiastrum complanatum TaxID=34168 RepID=A0ACC2EDI8_DIPCM|nr:hypothetical protein O6H91_02G024300 [Diphasiastrum complanatum]
MLFSSVFRYILDIFLKTIFNCFWLFSFGFRGVPTVFQTFFCASTSCASTSVSECESSFTCASHHLCESCASKYVFVHKSSPTLARVIFCTEHACASRKFLCEHFHGF